ncbi:MAG: GH3 auxin-responsive promoter family protein [Christensenella sp.]
MLKFITKAVLNMKAKKGREVAQQLEEMLDDPMKHNKEMLFRLMAENADTEIGKKYGYQEIKTVEDFQNKVPYTTYDDYERYIHRMLEGEKNLISAADVYHYAATSGSVDNPKKIPVVKHAYDIFADYSLNYAMYMAHKHCGTAWEKTRGLNLAEIKFSEYYNGVSYGSISGKAIEHYKSLLNVLFVSPTLATFPTVIMDLKYIHLRFALMEHDLSFIAAAFMNTPLDLFRYLEAHWQMITDDIINGTIDPSVKIPEEEREILLKSIKPDKRRGSQLQAEFQKGFDTPIVPRIWKKFAWLGAIGGGGFSVYTDKIRQYLGDVPIYFSVYGASEGLMAAPNTLDSDEMLLIPGNIFFEFIPITDDESSEEAAPLTLDQLEVGNVYEIVLTNLSGFVRYRIQDAIRVTGFYKKCPLIKFVYRLSQSINLAGEKTNDEALGWAVKETAKACGFEPVEYSAYADTDTFPAKYVIFIEGEQFKQGKDRQKIRDVMEEKMAIANPSYGKKVAEKILAPLKIHLLQSESFALYRDLMIMRGISGNQLKPVRLIDTIVRQKFFFSLIDTE